VLQNDTWGEICPFLLDFILEPFSCLLAPDDDVGFFFFLCNFEAKDFSAFLIDIFFLKTLEFEQNLQMFTLWDRDFAIGRAKMVKLVFQGVRYILSPTETII
jgi:hypothetical protein